MPNPINWADPLGLASCPSEENAAQQDNQISETVNEGTNAPDVTKKVDPLLDALSKAIPTQGHPNQVMHQLDDGTKVLLRRDFGDQAHNLGGPFLGKG